MTNKLVVIINSLKVPKTEKILLYEMKFLVPNYSCLQNPWLRGYRPQIPVLSVLCPQLNLLKPPPEQNSWVRHCCAHCAPAVTYPDFEFRALHWPHSTSVSVNNYFNCSNQLQLSHSDILLSLRRCGSIPGQSIWDLRGSKCHRERFTEHCGLHLTSHSTNAPYVSFTFANCAILTARC